jgi:hypothetical protein
MKLFKTSTLELFDDVYVLKNLNLVLIYVIWQPNHTEVAYYLKIILLSCLYVILLQIQKLSHCGRYCWKLVVFISAVTINICCSSVSALNWSRNAQYIANITDFIHLVRKSVEIMVNYALIYVFFKLFLTLHY